MNAGKYKKAKEAFEEIKDYKDSAQKIKTCNNKINASSSSSGSSSSSSGSGNNNHYKPSSGNSSSSESIDAGFSCVPGVSPDTIEITGWFIVCNNCMKIVRELSENEYYSLYGRSVKASCSCGNRGYVTIM